MFATVQDIEAFIRDFESLCLPKPSWTHHAHLAVGLWYLSHHSPDDALSIVRQRIRAYNEAVGTANTDTSGYHETLTRLFLRGIAAHILAHSRESLPRSLALLLQSPLGQKDWPLSFYSRERLFSVAARHGWLEPDLTINEQSRNALCFFRSKGLRRFVMRLGALNAEVPGRRNRMAAKRRKRRTLVAT